MPDFSIRNMEAKYYWEAGINVPIDNIHWAKMGRPHCRLPMLYGREINESFSISRTECGDHAIQREKLGTSRESTIDERFGLKGGGLCDRYCRKPRTPMFNVKMP